MEHSSLSFSPGMGLTKSQRFDAFSDFNLKLVKVEKVKEINMYLKKIVNLKMK